MSGLEHRSVTGSSATEGIHMVDASAWYHDIPFNVPELSLEHHNPSHTASVSCKEFHKRGVYSEEQWKDMKPAIWTLYKVKKKEI